MTSNLARIAAALERIAARLERAPTSVQTFTGPVGLSPEEVGAAMERKARFAWKEPTE